MGGLQRKWMRSWWVAAFLVGGFVLYSHATQKKMKMAGDLEAKLQELENEKSAALLEKDDLRLQINSQSDPAWIEMTLMKGLGVVPEGSQKVYFSNEE